MTKIALKTNLTSRSLLGNVHYIKYEFPVILIANYLHIQRGVLIT